MTRAKAVKTEVTASTQRLRMRSRNSLAAMMPICLGSMAKVMIFSSRIAEKNVLKGRFTDVQIGDPATERCQGLENRHLGFALAMHGGPLAIHIDLGALQRGDDAP